MTPLLRLFGLIVAEEGTASRFRELSEVIEQHGPHRLADYDPKGNPCDGAKLAA